MLADGKAPPAPPYYGIIEVQRWGARGMTTSEGDVGREKLGGKGKKRGFVTIDDHFGHPPPSHPRLQSRLIVTALGRHRNCLGWCLAWKRFAILNICSSWFRCIDGEWKFWIILNCWWNGLWKFLFFFSNFGFEKCDRSRRECMKVWHNILDILLLYRCCKCNIGYNKNKKRVVNWVWKEFI